jgi:hypothetical protein
MKKLMQAWGGGEGGMQNPWLQKRAPNPQAGQTITRHRLEKAFVLDRLALKRLSCAIPIFGWVFPKKLSCIVR